MSIVIGNKTVAGIHIANKEVQRITISGKTAYEKGPDYFYIENTYNGQNTVTFTTTQNGSPSPNTYATSIEYSKDKSTWNTLSLIAGSSQTIILYNGEKVYLRNDSGNFNYTDNSNNYYTVITASQTHNVGGNINTLLDYLHLSNVILSQGCFNRMFLSDINLVDASNLLLPSITLASHCYRALFNGCTSLTAAPELPATTLAERCYFSCFYGCTSLTQAPALPATILAKSCYESMFRYCESLTESPILPATSLYQYSYTQMFQNCTSLNSVTIYANDISASNCLNNWLDDVAATGDFYNLGGATFTSGASGIPSNWTVHNTL